MKRKAFSVVLAVVLSCTFAVAQPAAAGGCKEFGQNIASPAQALGRDFGQFASAGAPLNDTVEAEQAALCG